MSEAIQPSTLVVAVGGLGASQMASVEAAFRVFPKYQVVSAGAWNGYAADLPSLVSAHLLPRVAIIGHSFAAIPILEFIKNHRNMIHYAGFLDPVSDEAFVSSWAMPDDHPPFRWIQRTKFGIEAKLTITNAGEPTLIDASHNDLPHLHEVLDMFIGDVGALA